MQRYNKNTDLGRICSISGYMWLYLVINQDEVGRRLSLTRNAVKYLPMFRDYLDLQRDRNKKAYIYQRLADKYHISPDYAKHLILNMMKVVEV